MQIKMWWPLLFVTVIITACILIFPSDLRLADLLGKAGRLEEAITAYEELLLKEPRRDDIRLQLARLYIQTGEYEKAVRQVERLDESFLSDRMMLTQIADIYSQIGDKEKTISTLQRMLALAPEDREVRRKLADAYEWNHDLDRALPIYESLINEAPEDTVTLRKLASITRARGNWVKAKLYLRRILSLNPGDLESRRLLADIYVETDQKKLAAAEYERVLKATPDDTQLRIRLAELYLWIKEYTSGLAHYEYLAAQHPGNDTFLNKLLALTREEAPERAIGYLRERLSAQPGREDLRIDLYELSLAAGNTGDATETLKEIIANHPDQSSWLAKLGALYGDLRMPAKAAEVYRKLLEYPEYEQDAARELRRFYTVHKDFERLASLYESLAQRGLLSKTGWRAEYADLLARMRQFDDAIEIYEDLLEERPQDTGVRMRLANLHLLTGDSGKAMRLVKNGREKYTPENKRYLQFAADFFARQHRPDESIATYEQLAAVSGDITPYVGSLSDLYLKTKRYDKARRLYAQLAGKRPGDIEPQLAIADVYWRQHEYDNMHEQIWKVSRMTPRPRDLHARIGRFYFDHSFYAPAVSEFDLALQDAEGDSLTLQERALSSAWSNQPEKAQRAFRKYHQRFPNDYFSHYEYGVLLAGLGEKEHAGKEFKTALRLTKSRPDDRQVLTVRAGVYANQGAYDSAVRLYRTLISRYPDDPNAYLDYAEGLLLLKDYGESRKWLAHVLAGNPQSYRALRLQGRSYFEEKRFAEAAPSMQALLRVTPGDLTLRMDLSEAQLNAGDWAGSQRTLSKLLDLKPDYLPALLRLQSLRRENAEAFTARVESERQSSSFLKRLSTFSFSKALSSMLGLKVLASEQKYSSDQPGLEAADYRSMGLEATSTFGPKLEVKAGAEARRQVGADWHLAGNGAMRWQFSSFGGIHLSADLNALWNDPLNASLFDGRVDRLQSDLNLTLVKNILLWNRFQYEQNSLSSGRFGNSSRVQAQVGYRWGLKPYLLTYYQFYSLRYHYEQAANAAIISIPERETIHYLGAAIAHQLTRRLYLELSANIGRDTARKTTQYLGALHLEYSLFRSLRLRANLELGNQTTLVGDDKYRRVSVDFYYFY